MQIEGSKIAGIAARKLCAAKTAADQIVGIYSSSEAAMKTVRAEIAAALELIALLAPDQPQPELSPPAPDFQGFNDVSP